MEFWKGEHPVIERGSSFREDIQRTRGEAMDTSNFFKKIFAVDSMQNSILTNAEENSRFLSNRIDKLKSQQYGSESFYIILEDIFTEFVDVYEFDKKTAVLPEPIGTFKSPDEKTEWMENHLLAIEFDVHLGRILYNYHEWLVDNGHFPDIVLSRMVTDYPSVYQRILYDYISVLKGMPAQYPFKLKFNPYTEEAESERESIIGSLQRKQLYGANKPYFASFALPSLIERFMINFMQQDLVDKLMADIHTKHQNGEITLSNDDEQFVNMFLNKPKYMDGNREDAMKRCRDLFDSAGLIPDKCTEQIVLGVQGRNPITLGQFLRNSYAIRHIRKPYYNVLDILFSTKKVNLRNSIMHGASITFDPYAMCFSAVMLQIFWAVIDRRIFQ